MKLTPVASQISLAQKIETVGNSKPSSVQKVPKFIYQHL